MLLIYLNSATYKTAIINNLNSLGVTHTELDTLTNMILADADGYQATISNWDGVKYVEQDSILYKAAGSQIITSESNWGLDRIDQENLPLDNLYRYSRQGTGVDVYLLDTGINANHTEFTPRGSQTRITQLYDYRVDLPVNDPNQILPNSAGYGWDDNGHGTFVASIIGGVTYGVAKQVNLKSVKVFSEHLSALTSWIIRGLNAVLKDHTLKGGTSNAQYTPSVVNLSFSATQGSLVLEACIEDLIAAGVVVLASAGNNGQEIHKYGNGNHASPASMSSIIAVGATTSNDTLTINAGQIMTLAGPSGSNYGPGVDIYAPGYNIKGAWRSTLKDPIGETRLMGGTSVSVGFVAGLVSLYLENWSTLLDNSPSLITQTGVKTFLLSSAGDDKIANLNSGTNKLLRSPFIPSGLKWHTQEGLLITLNENEPLAIQLQAGNQADQITFAFANNSEKADLSQAGFALTAEGYLYGTANQVDRNDARYINVNDLENQEAFAIDVRGYIDYTFDVIITDKFSDLPDPTYSGETRTFSIRVLDATKPPIWIPSDHIVNINELPDYSDGFTVGDTINLDFTSMVYDPDNDQIVWNKVNGIPTLLAGDLPPGLTLGNGLVTGTLLPFPSITGSSLTRTYQFIIRISDEHYYTDKHFTMTVTRAAYGDHAPVWNDENSKSFDHGRLNHFKEGQGVYFRLEAFDQDNDDLTYTSTNLTEAVPAENIPGSTTYDSGLPTRVHGLPQGLSVTTDGVIIGVVSTSCLPGEYYFQVAVADTFNVVPRAFRIDVDDLNEYPGYVPIPAIEWNTSAGFLGELDETHPSYFSISAVSSSKEPIMYELNGFSNLPPGLSIDSITGLIMGNVGYVSEDTIFDFEIKVFTYNNPNIFVTRQFSISINKQYSEPISLFKCSMMGPDKIDVLNSLKKSDFYQNESANEIIFRASDPNFGVKRELSLYVLGGLKRLTPAQVYAGIKDDLPDTDPSTWKQSTITPVSNFHRQITAIFGDMKTAKAYDNAGKLLYEVLYVELYDPSYRAGGFKDGVPNPVDYGQPDISNPVSPSHVFPSSINNWRNDLAQLGMVGNERMPLWMTCQQVPGDESSVLGYTPCIELMFIGAGQPAQTILATLSLLEFGKQLYHKPLIIDRYIHEDWTDPNNIKSRTFKFLPGNI